MKSLKDIYSYRYLLRKLTLTSLTIQFKKSFLGISWLVIQPLITIVAWVLLHGAGLFDPGDTGIPYPAYVLLSTSIWALFANLYALVSNALVMNSQLLMQHNFPREILLLERGAVAVFNAFIPILLSLGVLLIYGVSIRWTIVFFPLALLPLILFAFSIAVLFALVKAVANDLNNFFDKAIVLLMYVTPVVYASDPGSPLLRSIIRWNPLTYLLGFPRSLLLDSGPYAPLEFFWVSAGVLFFTVIVWRYFHHVQARIIERLIA